MEALLAALVVVGICVSATVAGGLHLRRRNRINPRVRTAAPLRWLWSIRAPARAHRRLRRAVRGAHGALAQGGAQGLPVDGLADCLGDLEAHAFAIDDQLVVASRFSTSICRSMLRGLRPEVAEIEVIAARVAATVVTRSTMSDERLANVRRGVSERLDALDAAHAEVAGLEARWRAPFPASNPAQAGAVAPAADPSDTGTDRADRHL
jgi:hypothetical protein